MSEQLDEKIKELQYQQLKQGIPDSNWDEQFETDMKKTYKILLEDQFVEDRLGNFPIWSLVSKTSKITFLDKTELSIFESHLESMLCSYYMSLPPCMINDDICQLADQARMVSKLNLRRSSGTDNSNKINERIIEATQIRQNFSPSSGGSSSSPGFFKRLFGFR